MTYFEQYCVNISFNSLNRTSPIKISKFLGKSVNFVLNLKIFDQICKPRLKSGESHENQIIPSLISKIFLKIFQSSANLEKCLYSCRKWGLTSRI